MSKLTNFSMVQRFQFPNLYYKDVMRLDWRLVICKEKMFTIPLSQTFNCFDVKFGPFKQMFQRNTPYFLPPLPQTPYSVSAKLSVIILQFIWQRYLANLTGELANLIGRLKFVKDSFSIIMKIPILHRIIRGENNKLEDEMKMRKRIVGRVKEEKQILKTQPHLLLILLMVL